MPLIMIEGRPVLFAHVPKCAGTSVEHYLEAQFGPVALLDPQFGALPARRRWSRTSPQHADAATLERMFPPGFLHASFAVVRHPVARLVSVFRFQRDIEGRIDPTTTLAAWLEGLGRPPRRPWAYDNHTRPMVEMVPASAQVFRLEDGWDPVIDFLEALCEGGRRLPRTMPERNVLDRRLAHEKRTAPPVVPDDRALALIARLYADDFDRFGYWADASDAPA